MFIMFYAIALR